MPPIIQIFEFFLASPKQPNATPLRIFFLEQLEPALFLALFETNDVFGDFSYLFWKMVGWFSGE